MEIPKQLKHKDLRFVLLGKWNEFRNKKPLGKAPFEKAWQTNGYSFDDSKLLEHIKGGKNYGVIGGYGNLRMLDVDDAALVPIFQKALGKTFAVKTGSGGMHFYFYSDYNTNHVLSGEKGELRVKNYQVVGVGSKHPNGKFYEIFEDVPIKTLSVEEVEKIIKPYLRSNEVPLTKTEGDDTSRSGLEFRKCIALLREGKTRDEVYKVMCAYSKWATATDQYKSLTFEKAEDFVLRETEITKTVGGWVKYQCRECGEIFIDLPSKVLTHEHKTDAAKPKKYNVGCDPVDYVKSAAPEKLMTIVKDENYGERIIKEAGKKIVGEEGTKKVIIIGQFGGRLVKNSKPPSSNILFSEESGAGKDYNAINTLELLGRCYRDHKTRLSEKALSYYHPADREPYFSWDGKILYCEDSSNSFLNSDTVKVMMTGGSDIAIVKDGYLKHLRINGIPTFLVTSATAEPNKELNRRISSKGLDSSKKQTEQIMKFQSMVAKKGLPDYNQDIIDSSYLLSRVHVELPFSEELLESFPKTIQSRTNFDRLLDLVKACAALHQHSREWKNKETIMATRKDLAVGMEVFKLLYPQRATSLTHSQKKLVTYLSKIRIARAAAEIFRESGHFYYSQMNKMIEGLRSLANKGFVDISEGARGFKTVDLYTYLPEITPEQIGVDNGK